MKAMVYTAPSTLEIQDIDEPEPAAGEVLVDVVSTGICGSELHGIQTPGFRKPPLVMGHEFAGTTPDGRRVVVNPVVSCGRCDCCKAGSGNLCRTRAVIGIHRAGGFAERVAIPEDNLYAIPDEMSWETAALIEPLSNAVHAWRLAGRSTPQRVGIIGAGTIGLVCLIVAVAHGASEIVVTDLAEERLDLARRLGATSVAAELAGEFDVIFDAVGLPPTHAASVGRLRPGGVAVWLGLIEPQAHFDSQDLIRMEKTVKGSFAYTDSDFRSAIGLASKVDLDWVDTFALTDGVDIFMQLMNGRTDVVKALLRP